MDPDKGVISGRNILRSASLSHHNQAGDGRTCGTILEVASPCGDHPVDHQHLPSRIFGAIEGRRGVGCAVALFGLNRGTSRDVPVTPAGMDCGNDQGGCT